MEIWQENILTEFGIVIASLQRGACGAWIPLFTNDLEIAETRKLWVLDLTLIVNKMDQIKNKKCHVTTISEDNNNYGVKVMFVNLTK